MFHNKPIFKASKVSSVETGNKKKRSIIITTSHLIIICQHFSKTITAQLH